MAKMMGMTPAWLTRSGRERAPHRCRAQPPVLCRRPAGGVGLGLAVAKGFVEAMDGSIEIEDTPGGGATMVVVLRTAS